MIKKNIDKKVIVQKDPIESGNRYFIDDIEQQNLVLIRGNRYVFDFNDSSLVTTGYTNGIHPFAFSTTSDGSHNSGSTYSTKVKYYLDDVEVNASCLLYTSPSPRD